MRIFSLLVFSFLLSTLYSCNLKSSHPQADLLQDSVATNINEKLIQNYADSVDHNLPSAEKRVSLVYTKGNEVFFAEKYTLHKKLILLCTSKDDGALRTIVKKYYFNNDSLVLVRSSMTKSMQASPEFKDTLVYLRNNTIFKVASRASSLEAQRNSFPYHTISSGKNMGYENYKQQLQVLNDAIDQRNQFEVVFDQVNDLPEESYIILKSKTPNGYQASVLIENKDHYTDSLTADPLKFKGEKISFDWLIENKQAIYISAPARTTSASGLNR